MTSPRYVVGVDGGTESLRAGVFDATGKPLAFASAPYVTTHPHPGWAEQQPEDWWSALGAAVRDAVAQAGVSAGEIAALCLDTTNCTVVALDAAGAALRPALLWMDMRSAAQAEAVAATGDEALQVNSGGAGPVSAEWMIPKALWLKQHEPHVYEAAQYVCEYQDYLNFHLTGRMVASISNTSVRWHYNSSRGWPLSLLAKLDLSCLVAKWPADVLPLAAPVGGLTARAAEHLGLPPGLLVAQGGSDAFIGMLGLGVTSPGQMAMLTGSSHLQLGLCSTPMHGRGFFGSYPDAVLPGLHVVEGGQTSTGSVVRWLSRALVPEHAWPGFEVLNAAAAALPPGAEGLLCCEHFQGNRTPHTDASARGGLVGLTLKHTLAHVYRATLEGVAFGTELVLETMRQAGFEPEALTVAGGATKSDLWLQIHADISNIPLHLTEVSDAPALGCAVLAAVAAGLHPSIQAAAAAMVRITRIIQPNPERASEYKRLFQGYKALYPALRSVRLALESPPQLATVLPAQLVQAKPHQHQAAPPPPAVTSSSGRSNSSGVIISPSILAADFADLAGAVAQLEAAGADWVHVDMFDGTFAPNFTIGPPVVAALRRRTAMYLDCHLAVSDPAKYVEALHAAGASSITFQIEPFLATAAMSAASSTANVGTDTAVAATACAAAAEFAATVRSRGMRVAVSLALPTPADVVLPLLDAGHVDMVLVMTVACGHGGQAFQTSALVKVEELRRRYPALLIQVDGGVNATTAVAAGAAGANAAVAGTAVFAAPAGINAAVTELRAALAAGGAAWRDAAPTTNE